MKWIRTFPAKIPDNRNYVVDSIPVVYMDRNYLTVLENLIDDTVIVEWDIAFDKEDIETFEKHIADSPEIVHTAPYKLYGPWTLFVPQLGRLQKTEFEWIPRNIIHPPDYTQYISKNEPECDFAGFGMIYLPLDIVHQFLETKPSFVNDGTFCDWYYETIHKKIPVHWDVHLVHLHY